MPKIRILLEKKVIIKGKNMFLFYKKKMEKFSNFDTRCCVAQSINAFETIFVFSFGPHKKKITPKWHIWLLVNG